MSEHEKFVLSLKSQTSENSFGHLDRFTDKHSQISSLIWHGLIFGISPQSSNYHDLTKDLDQVHYHVNELVRYPSYIPANVEQLICDLEKTEASKDSEKVNLLALNLIVPKKLNHEDNPFYLCAQHCISTLGYLALLSAEHEVRFQNAVKENESLQNHSGVTYRQLQKINKKESPDNSQIGTRPLYWQTNFRTNELLKKFQNLFDTAKSFFSYSIHEINQVEAARSMQFFRASRILFDLVFKSS